MCSARGISTQGPNAKGSRSKYTTPEAHRALIAMCCAVNKAFSGGRLQVDHLHHGVSSQTFKAQMAVKGQRQSLREGKGNRNEIVIDSD